MDRSLVAWRLAAQSGSRPVIAPYRSGMAKIVLRVRLVGGDLVDVTLDDPGIAESHLLIDHAISVLADDSGVLRCTHGDRMVVLYGRGVAGLEIGPRGAVL